MVKTNADGMILNDFIRFLDHVASITIENEERELICVTLTNSEGIRPYLNREVQCWRLPEFAAMNPHLRTDIVFTLKDDSKNSVKRFSSCKIAETYSTEYSEEPPVQED